MPHQEEKLHVKNSHPRDKRVALDADTHTYSIDGSSQGVTSVTALVDEYFPKFDADAVLDMYYARWQQYAYKNPEYYGKIREKIKKMWETKRQQAAADGTRLHATIEAFYDDTEIECDKAAKIGSIT